eukprot:g35359.t1
MEVTSGDGKVESRNNKSTNKGFSRSRTPDEQGRVGVDVDSLIEDVVRTVVVFSFVLCWLPFHVGRYLFTKSSEVGSFEMLQISQYCSLVSLVLFYLSAAINPILYNIMSKKYRVAALKLFHVKKAPRRT